jgi:hypothetical protein
VVERLLEATVSLGTIARAAGVPRERLLAHIERLQRENEKLAAELAELNEAAAAHVSGPRNS